MLNLSDNELDRLSREAASQHDPGDLTGPQSWERLELRLDKELGRAGPDMPRGIRGIRRLPFQYAPVLLLVVGVTWYFVKAKGRKAEPSGSPPLTVVKTPHEQAGTDSISSLKKSAYSDKSTSTLYPGGDSLSGTNSIVPTAPASAPLVQPSAGPNSTYLDPDHTASSNDRVVSGGRRTASGNDLTVSGKDHSASGNGHPASANDLTTSGPDRSASRKDNPSSDKTSSGPDRTPLANNTGSNHIGSSNHTGSGLTNNTGSNGTSSGLTDNARANRTGSGLTHHSGQDRTASNLTGNDAHRYPGNNKSSGKGHRSPGSIDQQTAGSQTGLQDLTSRRTQAPSDEPSGPEYAYIQHPFSLRSTPRTSDIARHTDSALLAYAAQLQKDQSKKSGPALHINKALGIGLQFAPDFTSVNALAGDRPGSTLGLTLDYEVLDRLHLGTGLLFSRRNYTARGMDYHVPYDYYRQNGMKPVDFVKGTMNMLEIPINLRYDFSVTPGGTSFFATIGASSYLFGQENCNYYYDFFGSEACRKFQYSNTPNGLFASFNLSLGVETKLNNSLYALIAPYMKLPTGDMGFGKVRMSSVGINFAIRFTPVLSRKRY